MDEHEHEHPQPPAFPDDFRDLVTAELAALGFQIDSWQHDGLECQDENGEKRSLGLTNLFRRYRAAEPDERQGIVSGFLKVLRNTEMQPEELPVDLAEVADRILPRLGQPFPAEMANPPWSQELIGTDLVVNLVVDSEQYMRYVPTDLIEKDGRSPDDWISLAFQNLKRQTPEDWFSVVHEESGVLCGHCNDSYDAARAIILHQLAETGPYGWLVSVPTRDLVFALPVSKEYLQSFHFLKLLAENHYNEDPYPITDKVYWVRGLVWEEFHIELEEDGAKVYPSDEFIELLELEEEVEEQLYEDADEEELLDEDFDGDGDEPEPESDDNPSEPQNPK